MEIPLNMTTADKLVVARVYARHTAHASLFGTSETFVLLEPEELFLLKNILKHARTAHDNAIQEFPDIKSKTSHANCYWDLWDVNYQIVPEMDEKSIENNLSYYYAGERELRELLTKPPKVEDTDKALKTEITEYALIDYNVGGIMPYRSFCGKLRIDGILVYDYLKWYIFYLNVIHDAQQMEDDEIHEEDISPGKRCKTCGWSNLDGTEHL